MIKGIHGLFYSSQPEALRDFLRDKLKLPHADAGGGWLIFGLQEADLGVHPIDPGNPAMSGKHDVSFYTDDIGQTVGELKGRGVVFDDEVADRGYGFVTHLTLPGGVRVQLYQPKYRKPPVARPRAKIKAKRKPKARKPVRKKPAVRKKRR